MAEEPLPPKRPRGRPRKNPAPATAPASSDAATPPKRPRGRPRKVPVPPALQPPPKRPRGRPRKNPAPPVASAQPAPSPVDDTATPAARRAHTTANLNRVRLRELRGALESELAELDATLPPLMAELLDEFVERIEEIRSTLDKKVAAIPSPDDPAALMLAAHLGKAAARLAQFRQEKEPGLEELVKLARRLDKTARKLRRL